jgi:hypothetical protein
MQTPNPMKQIPNEKEFPIFLKEITPEQWQQLFELIPSIKNTKNYGHLEGMKEVEKGVFTFPYYVLSDIVMKFEKTVYQTGLIISFDWPQWKKGFRILACQSTDFQKLSLITLCKLITMIVRADRFNDGFVYVHFKNGTILKILEAMKGKIIG